MHDIEVITPLRGEERVEGEEGRGEGQV